MSSISRSAREGAQRRARLLAGVIRASRPQFNSRRDRLAFAVHASTLVAGELVRDESSSEGGDGCGPDTDLVLVGVGNDAETPRVGAGSEDEMEVGVDGWNESSSSSDGGGTYAFRYYMKRAHTSSSPAAAESTRRETVLIKAVPLEHMLIVSALVTGCSDPAVIELDVNKFTSANDGGLIEGYRNMEGLCEELARLMEMILTGRRGEVSGKKKRREGTLREERSDDEYGGEHMYKEDEDEDPLRIPRMLPGGHVGISGVPHPLSVGGNDLDPLGPSMIGIPGPNRPHYFPGNHVGPGHPMFGGGIPRPGFPGGIRGPLPPGVPPGARFDPYGPGGVPDPDGRGGGYHHPDLPPHGGPPPPDMFM